jgi:hypothetical protein
LDKTANDKTVKQKEYLQQLNKDKFIVVLNYASQHGGIRNNGCIAPRILILVTGWIFFRIRPSSNLPKSEIFTGTNRTGAWEGSMSISGRSVEEKILFPPLKMIPVFFNCSVHNTVTVRKVYKTKTIYV